MSQVPQFRGSNKVGRGAGKQDIKAKNFLCFRNSFYLKAKKADSMQTTAYNKNIEENL